MIPALIPPTSARGGGCWAVAGVASDGKLYMVKTFVKAAGGCSAPAAKNADEAKVSLGQLKFRQFLILALENLGFLP